MAFQRPFPSSATIGRMDIVAEVVVKPVEDKIVAYLKARRFEGDFEPKSLEHVLKAVHHSGLEDQFRKVLVEELLQKNPKVTITDEKYLVYKPPLDIESRKDLLKIVRAASKKGEGISEIDVEDSDHVGAAMIDVLESDNYIFCIKRTDGKRILFSRTHLDTGLEKAQKTFSVSEEVQEAFHAVTTSTRHIIDIERHLKTMRLSPMESAWKVVFDGKTKRRPKMKKACADCIEDNQEYCQCCKEKKKKRKSRVRDNHHVAEDLDPLDLPVRKRRARKTI